MPRSRNNLSEAKHPTKAAAPTPPYHASRRPAALPRRSADFQIGPRRIGVRRSASLHRLFCGIGGFRIAFERAGGKCVFSSDWDKFSRQTYAANFGETPHCPSLAGAGEGGRRPGEGCGVEQSWPTSSAAVFPASPSASWASPRKTASTANAASPHEKLLWER